MGLESEERKEDLRDSERSQLLLLGDNYSTKDQDSSNVIYDEDDIQFDMDNIILSDEEDEI